MTIIDQIRAELYPMPLGEKNRQGTLRYILFLTGPQEYKAAKGLNKDELVEALCRYFCAPKRFEQLWGRLSAPEQKILSLHVWSNGTEPVESAREIAKEFGIQGRQRSFFYLYERNGLDVYKAYYADQNSLLWLLVPRGVIFPAFRKELYGIVGEMKRRYSDIANRYVFFSRENRKGDFQNIVRFCNGKKLSVTKSGALSKASAIKIWEACGYEEFTAEVNAEPKEMRTTDGLWVTYPLTTLCMLGGLLGVAEEKVVVGGNALTLSSLSHEQLVKKLLEAYLKSKNYNEVSILRGINAKRGHNPADARQNIAGELRYCPVGQPVLISEFERYLRITNLFFARKDGRYVVNTGGGDYYYGAVWEQYEQPLIRIILSFFFALGLIDVTWGKIVSEDGEAGRIVPAAFTLNPLGAFAFGFTHSYAAPEEAKEKVEGGFTVLPDYTIVVQDSASRLKHELYFERWYTRVSATDEATVYRLDFDTVARALDGGITVADLQTYLSGSDKPLPENIVYALEDWKKQTQRIKIKRVTILECDDEVLLEEVIRYKGMGEFVREKINAAVVIDGNAAAKIKKAIEKNKRFCQDVL